VGRVLSTSAPLTVLLSLGMGGGGCWGKRGCVTGEGVSLTPKSPEGR